MEPIWQVFDLAPDATVVMDEELRVVYANRAAEQFFGTTTDEWLGKVPISVIHPDDVALVLSSQSTMLEKELGTPIEVRLRSADSSWRLTEIIGRTYRDPAGGVRVVNTIRDLTERRRWELAARRPDVFHAIVENAAVVLALVDPDGRIDSVSAAFNRQLGHDPAHVVGHQLVDFVAPDDKERFCAELTDAGERRGMSTFEILFVDLEGREKPYQIAVVNLLDDPVVVGLVVSAFDVSQRRALETRLRRLATTDSLTSLSNRAALVSHLEWLLKRPKPASITVFFVDLDRFKPVNDLYGHEGGDRVLLAIADRLRSLSRTTDVIARLGGDEFVLVYADMTPGAAARVAERIHKVIEHPVAIGDAVVQISGSVGFVSGAETTPDALLAEADAAMYRAKLARRGHAIDSGLHVGERRAIADDLARALEDDPAAAGLTVWYQPIVNVESRQHCAVEALLRWEHPRLGLLAADEFISIAVDSGLDIPLGTWALNTALRDYRQVQAHFPEGISVNLSPAQLRDPAIIDVVARSLAKHAVEPELLCIDVTERAVFERGTGDGIFAATPSLAALASVGTRIAIDDFGTGFSSLAHLQELPVHVLKADRTFIARVHEDPVARGIVAAISTLARATGKSVVAEGVEIAEQDDALLTMGIDRAQGHFYAMPMPFERLLELRAAPL